MFQGLKAMFKRGGSQNNKYDVDEIGLHVVNDSADVYTFYFGNDTRPMFSLRGLSLSEPTKEVSNYNGHATQVVKFGR
ncbi:hypothetical protein IJT10_02980, partial [bacterium]|nr:hypothetical protein [bacterium]